MTPRQKIPLTAIAIVGIVALMLIISFYNKNSVPAPDSLSQTAAVGTTGSGTTFYVDIINGNDNNSGGSESSAWKSIARVNSLMGNFKPGDTILFKRGGVWTEKLAISASGQTGSPITFGAYGTGNNPTIDVQGNQDYGVFINTAQFVTIQDLAIKNAKADGTPSAGIGLLNTNNVTIDRTTVENTTGLAGIFIYSSTAGRGNENLVQNSTITGTTPSSLGKSSGNLGAGVQLWGECPTCGSGNKIRNNTIENNSGNGITLGMAGTIIAGNTIQNNKEMGITAGDVKIINSAIDGNTVKNNCLAKDDCFGINFFRTGGNNIISNNTLSGQHDTKSDTSVKANDGYGGMKFGTGGIRFDGGDAYSVSLFGAGADYMSQSGNIIRNNTIASEYDGVQIFNYSGVTVQNNTFKNSSRAAVHAFSDNKAAGGTNKPITVTLTDNTIASGEGIKTPNPKDTIIGNTSPTTTTPPVAPVTCTPSTEMCDGKDNDCDGQIDEGLTTRTYYQDADGDAYGNRNIKKVSCAVPAGYVTNNKDCNDTVKATRRCLSCNTGTMCRLY